MFRKVSAKNKLKTVAHVHLIISHVVCHLNVYHSLTQQSLCTKFTPGVPFSASGHSVAADLAVICHQMTRHSWRSWQREH